MPAPRYRSRTYRRVYKKVASRVSLQYRRRKPKNARCGTCGAVLHGIPRVLPYRMASMPKTKKRPERPYGGNLCSRCTRSKIIGTYLKQ